MAKAGLSRNTRDRHHRKAAVLELGNLHPVHVFLAQAQRIEGEIAGLTAFAELSVGDDGDVLQDGHPDEHLDEAALGHGSTVGLEGGDTKHGVVEIGGDPARCCEHGNTAVLELSLAEVEGRLGGLLRELQGVEGLEFRAVNLCCKVLCMVKNRRREGD